MNVVVLQGTLNSDPVTFTLASGTVMVSFELAGTITGCGGSVPVVWFDPPHEATWAVGDRLLTTGTVRRRFYRSGGSTRSRTEVVATAVVPLAGRRRVRAELAKAVQSLQPEAA
jgi:single-strand DNA-binding protein